MNKTRLPYYLRDDSLLNCTLLFLVVGVLFSMLTRQATTTDEPQQYDAGFFIFMGSLGLSFAAQLLLLPILRGRWLLRQTPLSLDELKKEYFAGTFDTPRQYGDAGYAVGVRENNSTDHLVRIDEAAYRRLHTYFEKEDRRLGRVV